MIGAAAAAFPICYVIVQWLLVQLVALHRTLFAAALPVLILLAFIASVMITLVQCGIVLSVANLISLHLGGSYNSYVTTMVLGAMFWMVLPNAWSFRPDFRVRRDPNPTDANQAVATHLPKNRIEKIAPKGGNRQHWHDQTQGADYPPGHRFGYGRHPKRFGFPSHCYHT
jgi:hypothetical protein